MRGYLRAIKFILLSFLGLLFVLEAGGRIIIWSVNGGQCRHLVNLFEPDTELGYRHRPDSCSLSVRINSLGFRGKEVSAIKPANVLRVIAIGGSTTFGSDNNENDNYPALLEKKLNSGSINSPIKYEVINGGVVGYYTFHQVLRVKMFLAMQPDIVILFDGWNDFWYAYSLGAQWKPNAINKNISSSYTSFLNNNSVSCRLMQLLRRKILYVIKHKAKLSVMQRYQRATDNKDMYDNYQKNTEELVTAFRDKGVKVFLIKFPCLLRAQMDEREKTLIRSVEPFWEEFTPFITAHERLLERIDRVAKEMNVEVIDLNAVFNKLDRAEEAQLFSDIFHFTAKGNDFIAQVIYGYTTR